MRRLGQWLAETRMGKAAYGLGLVGVLALLAIGIYRVEDIRDRGDRRLERIEVIEQVKPIDLLRECLRTPKCRRLFRNPERLQVEDGEAQVGPRQPDAERDPQPPSTGGQPSEPGVRPGGRERGKPQQPGTDRKRSAPSPEPSPAPALPPSEASAEPPPEPSPGKSGETPAAEKGEGEQLCVDLIVSACVDRDVPLVP